MFKKLVLMIFLLTCLISSSITLVYGLSPRDEEMIRNAYMNGYIQAVESLTQDEIAKFKDPQYKCMYKDKVEKEVTNYLTIIKSMNPEKVGNNAAE